MHNTIILESLSRLWTLEASLFGAFIVLLCISFRTRAALPYPPGPPSIPVFGNAHQVPKTQVAQTLREWSHKYGDVLHFRIYGRHFVVINSRKLAIELFEKRSRLYSGRPIYVMGMLVGREFSVVFSQPGERFQTYRKLLKAWLNPEACKRHQHIQVEEVKFFIKDLVNPSQQAYLVTPRSRRLAGRIALRLAYGHLTESQQIEYANLADSFRTIQNEATAPGRWLVESFPILRFVPAWFPGAYFKRWAANARSQIERLATTPLQNVKEHMKDDMAADSFASHFLSHPKEVGGGGDIEHIIAWASNSFYGAGTETTAAFIDAFLLLMAIHPEIQRKAQDEIDKVVGTDTIPSIEHRANLPYLECIVKEVHRFHPVATLLFHSPIEDDELEGMLIPKWSTVFVNNWSIFHNPDEYSQPEQFRPERFQESTEMASEILDPRKIAFGLGRRNCPAQHFGEVSVFLAVSSCLSLLNVSNPRNAEEVVITASNLKFLDGLICYPEPFKLDIVYRSDRAKSLFEA